MNIRYLIPIYEKSRIENHQKDLSFKKSNL